MTPGEEVVLLVEDDPALLDAYRLVLSSRSYRVATARTVADAVHRLEDGGVDVVVCDLSLPDAAGPEVVRRLRRALEGDGDGPAASLVVLTGEDDAGLRRACRRAGASRYLVKPVSGGELAEILRSARG